MNTVQTPNSAIGFDGRTARIPTSDGQLYDLLARLFGYGTFDEVTGDLPYWQYRRKEVMKVSASRKKADVSLTEATRMALYCKAKNLLVTGPHSIYRHAGDARRWWAEHERIQRTAVLDEAISDAVAEEAQIPDSPWLDRLARASGPNREEVYQAWLKHRTST